MNICEALKSKYQDATDGGGEITSVTGQAMPVEFVGDEYIRLGHLHWPSAMLRWFIAASFPETSNNFTGCSQCRYNVMALKQLGSQSLRIPPLIFKS